MTTELRRRLLMLRKNLSFKELFVDDPLIPESKARTVESVIEEVGFDARAKFNYVSNSFKGFKKTILIALGKDTTTFTIKRWNNVARVYEDDKVVPDTRDKKDKYSRIEGTLEPINRAGLLIFNEAEAGDPDMQRMKAQMRNVSQKQKRMDGPDMLEGGVWLLKQSAALRASEGCIL